MGATTNKKETHMKDFTTTLGAIKDKYNTQDLVYDGEAYDFVKSVCSQFINAGRVSVAQVNALVKVSKRVIRFGPRAKHKINLEGEGFLGLNTKTSDVWVHSWDIKEIG